MQELKKAELLEINGGGITLAGGFMIVAGVVFAIGVIDGYLRPLRCN